MMMNLKTFYVSVYKEGKHCWRLDRVMTTDTYTKELASLKIQNDLDAKWLREGDDITKAEEINGIKGQLKRPKRRVVHDVYNSKEEASIYAKKEYLTKPLPMQSSAWIKWDAYRYMKKHGIRKIDISSIGPRTLMAGHLITEFNKDNIPRLFSNRDTIEVIEYVYKTTNLQSK